MADRPKWEWKPTPGPGGELTFLPVPLEMPIGRMNPGKRWRVALARGLWVENTPPWRLVVLGEKTVACYAVGNTVQERLALVQLVAQGWMPATAWAAAFGLHRNSLGNWTWRYRYFGLNGLRDDALPSREQLRPVVAAARGVGVPPPTGIPAEGRARRYRRRPSVARTCGFPAYGAPMLCRGQTIASTASYDHQDPQRLSGFLSRWVAIFHGRPCRSPFRPTNKGWALHLAARCATPGSSLLWPTTDS